MISGQTRMPNVLFYAVFRLIIRQACQFSHPGKPVRNQNLIPAIMPNLLLTEKSGNRMNKADLVAE
jgi:hypothetical protein